MQLTKWHPFREVENFFDKNSKSLAWPSLWGQESILSRDWAPSVDISETDKTLQIKAEIPGVKKEDVSVKIDNGVITISGEKSQEKEEKNKKYHRTESFYGSFLRSFTLPDYVDEKNIDASFKDGILNIEIPKTKEGKKDTIEIKVK